jgi:uncharacterized protein involved in exopolysaccharide biosynthesis
MSTASIAGGPPSLLDVIRGLLEAAWRRRYLICAPIVFMIPISIVVARMAPKVYEAKTIFLLQETSKENPILTEYAVGLNVKDRMPALTSLLGSEHILISVLQELGEVKPNDDPSEITWKVRSLSRSIAVKLAGNDLIELSIRSQKKEGLGRTLTAITKHFLLQLLSPEQSRLRATQDFLKEQVRQRRAELDAIEAEIAEFKRQNAELLPDIYEKNLQRLQSLESDLAARETELAGAKAQFAIMRDQLASANPIIGRLEESIVQVTNELTTLRSRYNEGHSEVQAAGRRLRRLENERQSLINAIRGVDQADVDALWRLATSAAITSERDNDKQAPLLVSQLLRLQDAKSKIAMLEEQIAKMKATSRDLRSYVVAFTPIELHRKDLEARALKIRTAYEALQTRYDAATTSLALGAFEAPERVKVIDPPADPTVPVSLPSIVFLIAGVFGGIALGIGLAVAAELLDQQVRTTAQFTALTHLPVLIRLPRLEAAANSAI